MKITKTRLKQIIKEELESVTNEAQNPIDLLVTQNAQKAIKIIDAGKTDPDDDPENLRIIRDVFEKILDYDKNEMISYIEESLPFYKTKAIVNALRSIATIFRNS